MNIKVKAGLDVAMFVVGAMFVGGAVRLVLDYLSEVYGTEQVINGVIFAGISVLVICLIKMMYNIRLANLESIKKLNEILGQPIILDSKPGANGNIGAQFTSKANPDGYTLLVGNSSIPISVSLYRNLGYDPLKDLTMISLITMAPSTLVTNPSYPVKTVSDLIKLAKENPGKINYGSAGSGSTPHLGMEMLGLATGTKFTHIPYKGSGPAVTALLGGEVDVLITNTSTIMSQVQSKRLNPVAVTSLQRSPIMPNIPTISETVPNFEVKTWYGLFGPANLPKEIVNKLNAAIAEAIRSPEIKEQLIRSGYEPETTSPEGFNQLMKDDVVAWGKVVKASGVQID
jgi:tripartite-type tricarboxylate transporter receptor subunit TctC